MLLAPSSRKYCSPYIPSYTPKRGGHIIFGVEFVGVDIRVTGEHHILVGSMPDPL